MFWGALIFPHAVLGYHLPSSEVLSSVIHASDEYNFVRET